MMHFDSNFEEAILEAAKPKELTVEGITRNYICVGSIPGVKKLPFALTVLLENVIRRSENKEELLRQAKAIISAGLCKEQGDEISFMPARVLYQDFTGVPVFVDFAAMRDAAQAKGINPKIVNPRIPSTLIVDHSVIADVFGCASAREENELIEASRNRERFAFLKWASKSFDNVEIVPPGSGICHQLNIERFCKVVSCDALNKDTETACFDSLVGTDSHTTTANGIGVLGWGVGGIEAEAASLGTPISMLVPQVVELRLEGVPNNNVSGMDIALRICELLRAESVVGMLVEVTGEGVASLSATQRACISNMTPEYGSTTTLFPVDEITMDYLELTGRNSKELAFAKAYLIAQGCFGSSQERMYSRTISLNLATVEPSLAGPSRPHNRVSISGVRERFERVLLDHGATLDKHVQVELDGASHTIEQGSVALAAITSCTTATDPAMMLSAGLLARAAVEKGLSVKPWVKCVLAPGSHASQLLLEKAGLVPYLQKLGFYTCGFGCMSCIGNSGSIVSELHEHAQELEYASVLSGNRNFDGRISPDVAQNYLAQPALVVAYALAGTVRIDLENEPLGVSQTGDEVYLKDIYPSAQEIDELLAKVLTKEVYQKGTETLFEGSAAWRDIPSNESNTFAWDEKSSYIRKAPYFELASPSETISIRGARALVFLKDFVTTDHISPAGAIAQGSPAARYLEARGIEEASFNTYGARRGNHEVMMRGTFANGKLDNVLGEGVIGPHTASPDGSTQLSVFDAAQSYAQTKTPLIILAGKMYGSGSSRDWAAKGPALLGVKAVIAESFERIHRSNLIQMGIVPLEFEAGTNAFSLGLDGKESFSISDIDLSCGLPEKTFVQVSAQKEDGSTLEFTAKLRVDTPLEGRFLARGGILPYVLDHLA